MITCFLCFDKFLCVRDLFKHFDLNHEPHKFTVYHCIDDGCDRSFYLKNTFSKHLNKIHVVENTTSLLNGKELIVPRSATLQDDSSSSIPSEPSQSNLIISNSSANPEHYSDPTFLEQTLNIVVPSTSTSTPPSNQLALFLSFLYANPLIPRKVVQDVVKGIQKHVCITLAHNIENVFNQLIESNSTGTDFELLKQQLMSTVNSPLKELDTEHKRFKYFESKGSYIPPKEIVIGQRRTTTTKRGVVKSVSVECTEQFVPLRNVLQNFFSLDGVLKETLDYIKDFSTNLNHMTNMIQGKFWTNFIKDHKDKLVFPLILFFDDYESGNVLGSHSGIHKLGAVYVSVGCIPPDRASTLANIFLALLFHSSDRVAFGNHVIFQPLIKELNFLIETGIDIKVPAFQGRLYFALGLIVGDNLGIHSIIGFNETFSSNFPCRICNVTKEAMKTQYYEEEILLRNMYNYVEQLERNCPSNTGIKEKCVWLSVKNFNLFDQVGVDIMHDILEGVSKYVIAFLILKYTRDLKYFTLQILNDRIENFDYGPDSTSKPCSLSMEHISKGNVRLSASEMLSFLRYFGLIIGDFVPTDDNYWQIYIVLRKILDLVMSTTINEASCELLKVFVSELNELYVTLTGQVLKPKFHFLVHYHSMLLKFGPLVHFWSMRFEAKHRLSKIYARATCNRRNLTKSLAIKHQLQLNEIFMKGSLDSTVSVGPSKRISKYKYDDIINSLKLSPGYSISQVPWAKVKGTTYKHGTIVVHNLSDLGEVNFMVIQSIFAYNNNRIIFECCLLNTISFDDHLHCFEVEKGDNDCTVYTFQEALISYIPGHINVTSNGKNYVTQRIVF